MKTIEGEPLTVQLQPCVSSENNRAVKIIMRWKVQWNYVKLLLSEYSEKKKKSI